MGSEPPPLALVQARNEAGGDAPGRKGCHCGAPLHLREGLVPGNSVPLSPGRQGGSDHCPALRSDWRPLGQSSLLPFLVICREKGASSLQALGCTAGWPVSHHGERRQTSGPGCICLDPTWPPDNCSLLPQACISVTF